MKCAACGTENNPGAKFCRGCGASLAAAPSPAPEIESPRAPAVEPGKVGSGNKGMVWAVVIAAVAVIAGGGGYAWYQHVETGRAAEAPPAQAKEKPAQARTEAEPKVQYEKEPAEPAPKALEVPKKAAQVKQQNAPTRPAAATAVALSAWTRECSAIPEGLKKTWCEERAKEKFCAANPRAAECR